MEKKKLIAYINAENELAESILKKAESYERIGADELRLKVGQRQESIVVLFAIEGRAELVAQERDEKPQL